MPAEGLRTCRQVGSIGAAAGHSFVLGIRITAAAASVAE